uniref:60S ribosomal protein L32 n=1 Tax=Spongospora subterranea TaxID=70186 RepID=A0A0H5R4W5_9EUKA|eukprot:CRZ08832.1 hypothetical protein [Spongospora subterranea]
MVSPLVRHNVIKKRQAKFIRHQAFNFMRVPLKWRRPKGIDSRVRRRFRDNIKMANCGYGTNTKHKHILPNGFKKFQVANMKELELLMMHNRTYAAEIKSQVSVRSRKAICERAAQLNIKVINGNAKVRTEENE